MPRPFRTSVVAAACLVAGITIALPQANATPADQHRQQDFAAAAQEFGVPQNVLMAVSYLESRWDSHDGTPSTDGGYGPMHLTDATTATAHKSFSEAADDPRGDTARPVSATESAKALDLSAPALHTVDLAASLTGVDAATLRTDPTQNIRGGAALLAHYQGNRSTDPAQWFNAVARYGDAEFATEVFNTLRSGMDRVTDDGQHVTLAAVPNLPNTATAKNDPGTECPAGLGCESVPAPYQSLGDDPTEYGNHDLANRPTSQKITYIVIHDTEGTWDGVMNLAQDPTYVSWHYTVRSNDGHIAQHVPTKDVAWHAGNWYVNAKSVGIEHEGFAADATWYTEALYRSSSKLVRYLAAKYSIPLDRAHIIGHDNVPGTIPSTVKGMHWDPGPFWDWDHYMDLLGKPIRTTGTSHTGMVTIDPDYATNKPVFTGCDADHPAAQCAPHGSTSVILHTQPNNSSPMLTDIGLHPDGTPGTTLISDHSSRAETGQQYAVAGRQGNWTAIWYLGQKGWFHTADAKWATGMVVTPKKGKATIPVYGRAYPEASAYPAGVPVQTVTPLQYTLSAGQRYTVGQNAADEYYYSTTFDTATHKVIKGQTKYLQIQFGHRIAYVNAADVNVVPSFMP